MGARLMSWAIVASSIWRVDPVKAKVQIKAARLAARGPLRL